jgi:diketogulonate reductase-like aldo/keto reductase
MQMPVFGLGTYLSEMGGECLDACTHAMSMGYVMIDTAAMYNNEEEVGAALRGVDRSRIFVVTKLQMPDHGRAGAMAAIDTSLAKLGLDYVDLYLIHNPRGGKCLETWRAMLDIQAAVCHSAQEPRTLPCFGRAVARRYTSHSSRACAQGKAKAVGVSNFGVAQLEGLREAGLRAPSVNQVLCRGGGGGGPHTHRVRAITRAARDACVPPGHRPAPPHQVELHPWLQQRELVAYCRGHGIEVMGYCPLARAKRFGRTPLAPIAARLGQTEAQLCIRWSLELGAPPPPPEISPPRSTPLRPR